MLPLKFKLDRKSLHIMYTSFIRPSMEYASVVWGGTYKSDMNKLEKIQIDAMRVITGATARSSILSLYNDTELILCKKESRIVCLFLCGRCVTGYALHTSLILYNRMNIGKTTIYALSHLSKFHLKDSKPLRDHLFLTQVPFGIVCH